MYRGRGGCFNVGVNSALDGELVGNRAIVLQRIKRGD